MDLNHCLMQLRKNYSKPYEEYKPFLEQCSILLKKEIANSPQNIKAVCLLSMIEFGLRKPDVEVLSYLYEAYQKHKDVLAVEDFSMLATDIAYFHIEDKCGKEAVVVDLLQQAIQNGTPFAETFYAMALMYYNQDRFSDALPLFKNAFERSSIFPYQFNYAVCLLKCGLKDECSALLQDIVKKQEYNPDTAKALLLLGGIYSTSDKIDLAKDIANDLYSRDYIALEIEPVDLAELMYGIGEYEKSICLHEKERYAPVEYWLSIYFFSLKQTKQEAKARTKLSEAISFLQSMITDISEDQKDNPTKWAADDSSSYISNIKGEILSIENCYKDIFYGNKQPSPQLNPSLAHICYYINCPRHSRELRTS